MIPRNRRSRCLYRWLIATEIPTIVFVAMSKPTHTKGLIAKAARSFGR